MFSEFLKKNKKLIFSVLGSVFTLLVICFFLLPTLLSRGLLVNHINKKIPGTLIIQKSNLSWFQPQVFENIVLLDAHDKTVLEMRSLETSANLWQLLRNKKDLKNLTVKNLEAYIFAPKNKSSNLKKALGISPKKHVSDFQEKKPHFVLKLPFQGHLNLENAKITFQTNDTIPVVFQDLQLNCLFPKNDEPLIAHLCCDAQHGENSGSVNLKIEMGGFDKDKQLIIKPFEKDVFSLSSKGYMTIDSQISELPTTSLTHLLSFINPKLGIFTSENSTNKLKLQTKIQTHKNKSKISLCAKSEDFEVDLNAAIQQSQFFLTSPSKLHFQIKPNTIDELTTFFNSQPILNIKKEVRASVQIDRLTMPLNFENFNFSNLSCNAKLSISPIEFVDKPQLKNFKLSQIKASLDTFDLGENLTLHFNASGTKNQTPTHLKIDGQFSKLMDYKNELKGFDQIKAQIFAQAKDFPTLLVTRFFKDHELANEALGPLINCEANFLGSLHSAELSMELNSSRIQIPQLLFELSDKKHLRLMKKTPVQFRINPKLAKKASDLKLYTLQPIDLSGHLERCLFEKKNHKLSLADLQLNLNATPFDFFSQSYQPSHVDEANFILNISEQAKIVAHLKAHIELPKDMPLAQLTKHFQLYAELSDFQSHLKNLSSPVEINATAENWNAHFVGNMRALSELSPTQPIELSIDCLNYPLNSNASLQLEKIQTNLSLENLFFNNLSWDTLATSGSLEIKDIKISDDSILHHPSPLKGKFELNPDDHLLSLELFAHDEHLKFNLKAHDFILPERLNLKGTRYSFTGAAKSISTKALSHFVTNISLPELLGPSCELETQLLLQHNDGLSGKIQAELKNPIFTSRASFELNPQNIKLSEPFELTCSLTPSQYNLISPLFFRSNIHLEKTLKLQCEISDALLKLNENKHLSLSSVSGFFHIDELRSQEGGLYNLNATFNTSHLTENLSFKFLAQTTDINNKEGVCELKVELNNPLDESFKAINPKIDGQFFCHLKEFPTAFLTHFTNLDKSTSDRLNQALGASINLNCDANFSNGMGPILLDIDSNLFKGSFSLNLNNYQLSLNEDLEAQIYLNTKESHSLLHFLNPLLTHPISDDTKAQLKISKENFSLPSFPCRFEQIFVNKAQIILPQLELRSNETYCELKKFLRLPCDLETTKIWTTPILFSLNQGELKLLRNDFLLDDKAHLAIWGKRNLNSKESSTYYLSIPSLSLKNLFGFANLPENYTFQIPFKAFDNNLEIEWDKSTSNLNDLSLYLNQRLAPNSSGESTRKFESLLEIISKTQPSGYAPMQTFPLPWVLDTELESEDEKLHQKEQSAILHDFFKSLKKTLRQ